MIEYDVREAPFPGECADDLDLCAGDIHGFPECRASSGLYRLSASVRVRVSLPARRSLSASTSVPVTPATKVPNSAAAYGFAPAASAAAIPASMLSPAPTVSTGESIRRPGTS